MEIYLKNHANTINAYLEKILPKEFNAQWLEFALGKPRWEHDKETYTKSIAEPSWELLSRGGKRWRPFLMLLSYKAVNGKGNSIKEFLALPELIHNGTLIIDDIEDSSSFRRGKKCIHKLYGNDIAINAGNALYYLPLLLIMRNKSLLPKLKLKIYDTIMEGMIKLAFGQGTDIHWHKGKKHDITENQYLQMCAYKTGTLAKMSAKLGAILGNSSKEQVNALGEFAESIGVAFQIQDDILNITNEKWGKAFGDDISEGKKTLMVIRLLEIGSKKDKQRLLDILSLKTRDKKLIKEAVDIIKKYKAIDYAKNKAKELVTDAWNKLDPLIEDYDSKNKLRLFADFLINRDI